MLSVIIRCHTDVVSNTKPIPFPNGCALICSLLFSCIKIVLCVLLKLSCCFLSVVLDKILLIVYRRFSADVSFLLGSKFKACDSMAVLISIHGIDFGAEIKFGPKLKKEATFLSISFRSSRTEVFLGKGLLKICSKFTGEHPCQSAISIKLLCNLIGIALRYGCSPVNLLHIFRTPFPKNTSGWLLLILTS